MPESDDDKLHGHDHDHDHDDMDEEDGEEGDDVVVLEDAEGNAREYVFLAVVEVDEEAYALLTPAEEDENEENPTEVFLFQYEVDDDGNESFSDIEDEELFKRVQAAAEQLFAEMDGDE